MLEFICGIFAGGIVAAVIAARCRPAQTEQEETDAEFYRRLYAELMDQPNCNDCGDRKECEYRPEWGAAVRINCPLHVRQEDGGGDD